MKDLFWKSFCETGRVDIYLLYKEYEEAEELKLEENRFIAEQAQSSQVQSDVGGSVI